MSARHALGQMLPDVVLGCLDQVLPGGALTPTGAKEPALFGTSLPITQRTPKEAYASV